MPPYSRNRPSSRRNSAQDRQDPVSFHQTPRMQCCNVARISAPRDAARPKNSHLVDPIRGAEARPGVRVPVLWANFGLFGPQRPKACGFSLRGCCRPGAILPRGALMFLAEPGLAAAAAGGGGAAALARAPDAAARRWLPAPCRRARYRACVWRRGAAQRAPRARCATALRPGACAHPACALGAQPLPGCLVVTVRLAARAGIHRHSSPDELFAVAAEPAPRYWFAL